MVTTYRNPCCHRATPSPQFRPGLAMLAISSLAILSAGCWQEVPYDPSKTPPASPKPAAQNTSAEPQQDQRQLPTVGELFASDPVPATDQEAPETTAKQTQPDAPLATALQTDDQPEPATTAPAPPSELDWLDAPPSVGPPKEESPEVVSQTNASRTALAAWRMGSKWSLAAAYFAKGLDSDRYAQPLSQAEYAARLLDLQLPAFPENVDNARLQATTAAFLIDGAGTQLVEQLGSSYPADHAALVELAIKTHALLLVYTPRNKNLEPLVAAIRQAAHNSNLPKRVWQPLVDLLEQRAEFVKVKQAVFQLHRQATSALSGSAND